MSFTNLTYSALAQHKWPVYLALGDPILEYLFLIGIGIWAIRKKLLEKKFKSFVPTDPRCSFHDVEGMDNVKSQLLDAVKEFQAVGKNWFLLTGQPGSIKAKSKLAEALACHIGSKFLRVSLSDLRLSKPKETIRQIRKMFRDVSTAGECIVLFDQVECMLRKRADLRELDAFRACLDELRGGNAILVVSTCFPEALDPALTREGCFDFRIEVPEDA